MSGWRGARVAERLTAGLVEKGPGWLGFGLNEELDIVP